VVPFDLKNTLANFICLMNNMLREYLDNFVIMFIDDILIYSKTKEEHEEHLRMVLQTLREHQIYTKLSKCEFYTYKVQYLGHAISREEILVDLEKVKEILDWPVPKDLLDVWSFMGIIGYYCMFIEVFSNFFYPITSF